MARLNEPVVAPDSFEILRRKFLRQNRDIARINSTQSLRIRSLENECARMLSENLELRGQILRLETEIQESRAQKIADHALEIKEKMEAQLLEWGSMLASLGSEPIRKPSSPRANKKARRDPSLGLAGAGSPRFRRRNTSELEAAAIQEGRLAPIWENRPCPRETLNRDEILALCSEAAETDSPDLGPPPVSRFVDEEPVKIELPQKTLPEAQDETRICAKISVPHHSSSHEFLQEEAPAEATVDKPEASIAQVQTQPIIRLAPPGTQVSNNTLKRKSREDEEKENTPMVKIGGDPAKSTKLQPEKAANRPLTKPPNNLSSSKKDGRENNATSAPVLAPRRPLGAKTTNEVLNSPKKSAKGPLLDEIASVKAEMKLSERAKEKSKSKRKEEKPKAVEITAPELAPVPASTISIDIEPESLSSEPNLSMPNSPESATTREEMRDTPPPVDISFREEAGRGGRRARSNVSYAEPNLRDKMRRPTKQLFDAVAGEGKALRRTSQSKPTELSSVKSEEKGSGWKALPNEGSVESNKLDDVAASPLAQKVSRALSLEDVNTMVVTDRRKRDASTVEEAGAEDLSLSASTKSSGRTTNKKLEEIAAREAEVARLFDGPDIYEFTSSSPNRKNQTKPSSSGDTKKISGSRGGKSRRTSSAVREDLGGGAVEPQDRGRGSRKRASMVAQKTNSSFDADTSASADGDSSFNSTSSAEMEVAARGVSMRRRSMML